MKLSTTIYILKTQLQESSQRFWGKPTYYDFFRPHSDLLTGLKTETVRLRFPGLSLNEKDEAIEIAGKLAKTVKQYLSLNWLKRFWWRLTTPIKHYIILHELLTLSAMDLFISSNQLPAAQQLYNTSALSLLVSRLDRLFSLERQQLNKLINDGNQVQQHAADPENETYKALMNIASEQDKADTWLSCAERTLRLINLKKDDLVNARIKVNKLFKESNGMLLTHHPDKNTLCKENAANITIYLLNFREHCKEIISKINEIEKRAVQVVELTRREENINSKSNNEKKPSEEAVVFEYDEQNVFRYN